MLDAIRTDRGVIRKVLRGNPDAFRLLVDRYGGMVYGIACAHIGNAVDAEDISQETFVRLYQWLDRLSSEKSVGAWLVHVARSVAIDWLRKQGRETARATEGIAEAPSLPNPARDELHRAIWDQLATLNSEQREILVLYYFRSKRRREIARLLGISPYAASKRLQRARDALGRRLIDTLGDDWAAQKRDASRTNRVMAAVAAAPVAWKPSASLALAGAAITGTSATKVVAGLALSAIVVAVLAYGGWRYFSRPYSTTEITAASSFVFEPKPASTAASQESAVSTPSGTKGDREPTAKTAAPGAADEHPLGTLRVHGLLLTDDGQPVSGVTVTIDNREEVDQNRRIRKHSEDEPLVEEMRFTAVSDLQGRFAFDSIPFQAKSAYYREDRIWAKAGGLCAGDVIDRGSASRERYCELVMRPESALTGLVTDPEGKPIEGAFVGLRGAYSQKEMNSFGAAWTEENGRFTFDFMPPGSYRMEIGASGFVALQTPWVKAGDPDLVFQLERGNTISGRVIDTANGRALPHVGIIAGTGTGQERKYANGETDDAGRFVVGGLDSGTFELRTGSRKLGGEMPYVLQAPVSVVLKPGQPVTGVELKVVIGATVSGRVVDAETGQPPQARSWVGANKREDKDYAGYCGSAIVGEDGRYKIAGLPLGKLFLSSYDRDRVYADATVPVTINAYASVEGVDFSLVKAAKQADSGKVVQGKVVDAKGTPVPAATVVASPVKSRQGEIGAQTDAGGEFSISFYQAPGSVYIQAFMDDAMSRRLGPVRPGPDSYTLQLEPAGRIEGEVVDESGAPVANAVVAAIGDEDGSSMLSSSLPWRAREDIPGTKARTSDQGVFSMPSVLAGDYRLEVYVAASTVGVPVARGQAQVRAGQTLRTRLVIDTHELGTIEGAVTLNGAPLQGAPVQVTPDGAEWTYYVRDHTDAEGRYVLQHIQPGTAKVTVEMMPTAGTSGDPIRRTQGVAVTAGQIARADFSVSAKQTGAAEGYVYINGAPMGGAAVEFTPANAEENANKIDVYTNGEGWFSADGLEEGEYAAETSHYVEYGMPGFMLRDAQQVSISAGQTARIDFYLNAGRIEGTVSGIKKGQHAFVSLLDGSGNLFSLTPQVLQSMEERLLTVLAVLQDGPFTFEGIPEGNYVLGAVSVPEDASQEDIAPAIAAITAGKYTAAEVQVIAGETVNIDLALP
jgi:RNA polymerase sigma-70 factor (ECF subfamily)